MSTNVIYLYVLNHERCVVEYDNEPEFCSLGEGIDACLMALEDGAEIVIAGEGIREVAFDVVRPLFEAAFDWSPLSLALYRRSRVR